MKLAFVATLAALALSADAGAQAPNGQQLDQAIRARMQAQQNDMKDTQVQEIRRALQETLQQAKAAHDRGDYAAARRLWLPAADSGVAAAQFGLGMMYEQDIGAPRDDGQAVKWLGKAADLEFGPAEFGLGMVFLNGRGVARDDVRGAKLIRRAAVHGVAQAKFNLAVLYETGRGVAKDPAAAAEWYHKASVAGIK